MRESCCGASSIARMGPARERGARRNRRGRREADPAATARGCALLGAVYGREGISGRWRRAILTCRPLTMAGAAQPRPLEFWPVDAVELAEALLLAGEQEAAERGPLQ